MRRSIIFTLLLCTALGATAVAGEIVLESDEDKILYTLGIAISQNLAPFSFTEAELAKLQAGLVDGALGRDPKVEPTEFGPRIDPMLRERMAAMSEIEKVEGAKFVAQAAQQEGAVTTDSGLVYLELEAGSGATPESGDSVKIHYRGTRRDGSTFDSSLDGPEPAPATFNVDGVIPCFSEGLKRMKVGGKSKLTCPPDIAYGDAGSPPSIRPGETLTFEVQLLGVESGGEDAP